MRKALVFTTAVVTSLTLITGCGSDDPDISGAPAPAPSASVEPEPTVSSSPSPAPSTPPPTEKPAPPKKLKIGAKGPEVLALQERLVELGYWIAKTDGKFGGTTQQAVFALQKAAGVGRDGVVGPKTHKALKDGVRPRARSKPGSGYLVEIDLRKQLLMLVEDGEVVTVLNTSTGSNENYEHEGRTYLADTPTGRFKVGRQIDGMRHGPLGDLWRPKYFNGGIAVHGAASVPPYPASHGCARLSNAAMNWIWSTGKIPLKTKVWVYRS